MANTYIKRTCDGGYTSTFTWSAWVKRSAPGNSGGLFCNKKNDSNSNSRVRFYFSSADRLAMEVKDSTGGDDSFFQTNKLFRDVNAWYNIVLAYDTTQSAENDRIKLWINNEEVTSWEQFDRASSGFGTLWSSAMEHRIGTQNSNAGTNYYFNGYMSHIHFTYGTAYTPSAFGETDATTGEWKIKTDVSVTYGSQGYFVLKDGNSLTDQSGEGNNFTLGGGTLTDTKDCPSNVLATMNSLANIVAPVGLESGNNTVSMTNSKGGILSTLACTGGKYYAEMEIAAMPQDSRFHIGILPKPVVEADDPISTNNKGIMLSGYNAAIYANSGSGSAILNDFYGNATGRFSGAPILGCAVDLESATKTMAISINGAWVTGSNTTDASFSNALKVDISTPVALEDDWFFGCGSGNGSGTTGVYNWNFGNGYFSTTAVTSAGTAGSTPGTFEYDVPSGYEPLSTKGLNA